MERKYLSDFGIPDEQATELLKAVEQAAANVMGAAEPGPTWVLSLRVHSEGEESYEVYRYACGMTKSTL